SPPEKPPRFQHRKREVERDRRRARIAPAQPAARRAAPCIEHARRLEADVVQALEHARVDLALEARRLRISSGGALEAAARRAAVNRRRARAQWPPTPRAYGDRCPRRRRP